MEAGDEEGRQEGKKGAGKWGMGGKRGREERRQGSRAGRRVDREGIKQKGMRQRAKMTGDRRGRANRRQEEGRRGRGS